MAKGELGTGLIVIGVVGVAGYIAYKYFIEGAQAAPGQGGFMVQNLRASQANYLTSVGGFMIDDQVVDIWTCLGPDYLMLDPGLHSFTVDWKDGVTLPLYSEFTIVGDTCLVIEAGGGFAYFTQNYGCIPYSFKCVDSVHYRCNSMAQDVLLYDGCEGTWYQPPEV